MEHECRGTCVCCQGGIYDDLAMCCGCWEENLSKRDLKIKQLVERVKELEEALGCVKQELGWLGSMLHEGPDVLPLEKVLAGAKRDFAKVHAVVDAALERSLK